MQLFYARTTASQNQDFFTLIHFKRWFFFFWAKRKPNRHVMNKWSAFSVLVKCQPPQTVTIWKVVAATFQVNVFVPLQAARRNYLKECRKCTLLRFSFSGLWDAMWENSLKMSRYVASPGEEKKNTECKWWKMIRVRSDSSRRRKRRKKKKVWLGFSEQSKHLLYETFEQRSCG